MSERVEPLSRPALLGSVVGFSAWAVVFGVMLASSGDWVAFGRVTPLTLSTSIGLWTVVIAGYDGARQRFGPRAPEALLAMWGGMLLAVGLLLVLVEAVVLPEVDRHDDIRRTLEATGSVMQVAPWIAPVLTSMGAALAIVPVWRARRR